MGSVDVAGEVACLKQRLLGLRLANLYDLNGKVGLCLVGGVWVSSANG